jgi:biotin carboxyl carrier protein
MAAIVHHARQRVDPTDDTSEPRHGARTDLPITLLVSPYAGRLRILPPQRFWQGHEWIDAGQPVARIERGEDGAEDAFVTSPVRGRLGAVLGRDGEPVKAGQAVAWVETE